MSLSSADCVSAAASPVTRLFLLLFSAPARMMRDNETSNTVVHFFASTADRRGRCVVVAVASVVYVDFASVVYGYVAVVAAAVVVVVVVAAVAVFHSCKCTAYVCSKR